jgi:hypothetical protein
LIWLVGWNDIFSIFTTNQTWDKNRVTVDLNFAEKRLKIGGKYKPSECKSRYKLAIVVPYRQRKNQLKIFLKYMHPFLQRQQLEYTMFIIEQTG